MSGVDAGVMSACREYRPKSGRRPISSQGPRGSSSHHPPAESPPLVRIVVPSLLQGGFPALVQEEDQPQQVAHEQRAGCEPQNGPHGWVKRQTNAQSHVENDHGHQGQDYVQCDSQPGLQILSSVPSREFQPLRLKCANPAQVKRRRRSIACISCRYCRGIWHCVLSWRRRLRPDDHCPPPFASDWRAYLPAVGAARWPAAGSR